MSVIIARSDPPASSSGVGSDAGIGAAPPTDLSLKDAKKTKPGSVPLGHLSRLKLRYKAASKARKGTNPFTGEPATFKAKPATLQPRFTAGKAFKDEASKYFKKKMK